MVEVGGPPGLSGPPSLLVAGDKSRRSQDGELLADGARGGRQRVCEVVDRRFPPPLQGQKSVPLCPCQFDQGGWHVLHNDDHTQEGHIM